MTSARKHLADTLSELLPKKWKLIPQQDNFDAITDPVVMLSQTRISPSAQAPLAVHDVEFEVGIIDPSQVPSIAEDSLDTEVDTLLFALETIPTLAWTGAERVVYDQRYQGWKITIVVTTKKEN
jgi:hypothetical protein